MEGDLETREKAQKAGISTGTYIRNQEMQDNEQEDVKKKMKIQQMTRLSKKKSRKMLMKIKKTKTKRRYKDRR
ncbi:hypothetical protein OE903_08395 [Bacillus sp. B6(2022)]|nr:hypothetical protein [Bacillus sp. B6(2022)]